ncbi:hypothetical protein BASA81_006154 [Batrachochytrium salamandrivorans]|nr:hypothetical protein BASA81_006154 [Batrachochytrium salamandrivorans]
MFLLRKPAAAVVARGARTLSSLAAPVGGTLAGGVPPSESSEIARETLSLTRDVLLPLNEQFVGPLSRRMDERIPLPVVLVIGNHSSGKSTFINYCVQQRVQESGVAPTDDGYTVICPGEKDVDQDGPSLVGDPNFGFTQLRSFGPAMNSHLRLKIREGLAMQDLIMIDSPGMIDSPVTGNGKNNERGYDFEGVTRWLAERADVILLFFDPDKPGTTGETLSVLTTSLVGMEHKFLIVLNKVDMFERSQDFARSYGALCWNLSKVIPRKDLPRIYTTYTPLDTPYTSNGNTNSFRGGGPTKQDLDSVREEIMREIHLAPFKRVDNMITSVFDQTRLLKMHLEILDDTRADFKRATLKAQVQAGGVAAGGLALGLTPLFAFGPELINFSLIVCASSVLGAAGLSMYHGTQLEAKAKSFLQEDHALEILFRKRFAREIAERDESVLSVWQRVKPQVRAAVENFGLLKIPKVSSNNLQALDSVLLNKVPKLRKAAASRLGKVGN